MKTIIPITSLLLFLVLSIPVNGQSIKVKYKKKKIAKGLVWKTAQVQQLFGTPQNINILEVKKGHTFDIAYEPSGFKKTSAFGKNNDAIAAINGGFFDMRKGGSVTYLKVNDQIINYSTSNSTAINSGAVCVLEDGSMTIESAKAPEWYDNPENCDDVLFTGPLLIENGKKLELPDLKFNTDKHPRTCACTTTNNRTLLITIDGRHKENAAGMSLPNLTDLLFTLKCKNAVNLDGGGSTTMWIKDVNNTGVVNKPSDNRKFDNGGERRCANAILIKTATK